MGRSIAMIPIKSLRNPRPIRKLSNLSDGAMARGFRRTRTDIGTVALSGPHLASDASLPVRTWLKHTYVIQGCRLSSACTQMLTEKPILLHRLRSVDVNFSSGPVLLLLCASLRRIGMCRSLLPSLSSCTEEGHGGRGRAASWIVGRRTT